MPAGFMRNETKHQAAKIIVNTIAKLASKNRKAKAKKKKGLNKVEIKQTKALIAKDDELRYCPQFICDSGLPTDAPPTLNQQDRQPVAIPNTGQGNCAYFVGFETGLTLGLEADALNTAMPPATGFTDGMLPIRMYNFTASNDAAAQGQDPGTIRDGEYLYAHAQRVRIQVQMNQARDGTQVYIPYNTPMKFRVLVVKRRPSRVIAGDWGVDFRTELFRNFDNNVVGLLNSKTVWQLDNWKVNSEALEVIKDIRFKLSPPLDPRGNSGGTTQTNNFRNTYNSFPDTKQLDFYLPKPKHKIKWNGTADSDPRDSFNYKTEIL